MGIDKNVTLGYAFIVLFFSIGVDFDHIPLWVFGVKIDWHLPNLIWVLTSEGRPLHTIYIFAIYGIMLSAFITAFVVRRKQPETMDVIQ